MSPSIWQILIVVILILVLFGAGRIPRVMEDLAKGMKAFKKGMDDDDKAESETPSLSERAEKSAAEPTKTPEKE